MKKTLLTLAAVLIVSVAAQAQGLVGFYNSAAAGSKISTNSVLNGASTGLTAASGGLYYYALFYSTTQTTVGGSAAAVLGAGTYALNASGWTFSGDYATNTATAGRVNGQQNADQSSTVTGLAGGGSADFVVIGWSANIGSTIAALQAYLANPGFVGWVGESAVSPSITVGDGVNVPTPTILSASGAVTGFTLGIVPVPEPTTMALGALGALSLLGLRRRK